MAVLAAMVVGGCSAKQKKGPAAGRYSNTTYLFNVVVPPTWTKQENISKETPVRFVSPKDGEDDKFRENIEVRVEKLPGSFDTKSHAEGWIINMQRQYQDFELLQKETVTINGTEMVKALFVLPKPPAETAKVLACLFAKGSRGFVILCTALPSTYGQYDKQFEEICNSFEAY
jgi:hypothetical protein